MDIAVVYCRVSTKEQTKNLSLPTQRSRCSEYCQRHGYVMERVFEDAGESAKTTDRPQFQEMLRYLKANKGRLSYLVVYDLSRFSRNIEDHISVHMELASLGIKLRSVNENVDESP